jgi:hypothetical protein
MAFQKKSYLKKAQSQTATTINKNNAASFVRKPSFLFLALSCIKFSTLYKKSFSFINARFWNEMDQAFWHKF